ncbi:MAG: hypothetical protein MUP85_02670 [Candidatus Lokiarchaeota archaeon]|nr:hypothetical protein [Candidatus Lokiarchaeota archaeon]
MLLVGLIFCIGTTIAEDVVVSIDIKPDTVNNTINLNSQGLLPVAILGTEDFNVMTDIDNSTLRFGTYNDDDNSIEPIRLSNNDTNGDGFMDLIMKFEIEDLANLSVFDTVSSNECVYLSVFGTTNDDVIFSGEDCVYKPENSQYIIPEPTIS